MKKKKKKKAIEEAAKIAKELAEKRIKDADEMKLKIEQGKLDNTNLIMNFYLVFHHILDYINGNLR